MNQVKELQKAQKVDVAKQNKNTNKEKEDVKKKEKEHKLELQALEEKLQQKEVELNSLRKGHEQQIEKQQKESDKNHLKTMETLK